ncbi:HD domain-containing protein [Kitasatospora sp. NBC_00240]|uniref:HD domain-containing protein n=1 Tax=Kitasatospora sp. NBC_00240 TaxID=2903567 RepID=UPI00225AF105|nr:HD domain-containing protein [Kitasatospora sp. NBC_00240]MCX5211313.1 HD domain-containing protein [Kitasatospora sp. NBC_00240]
MPSPETLTDRWSALLRRCGAGVDPEPYGRELLRRWAEPQRRYHTTEHLRAVLDHIDTLAGHADDPDTVRLAAWFHDAVYKPDRSENEERSAALAVRALAEAGLPERQVAEVARLVRLTVTHHPEPGDRDGEVLCDADLAVLGGPPEAYAAYAAAVREEYAFVPDEAFRAGRAEILRGLLALPALYRTPAALERFDAAARANLAAELGRLEG